MPDTQPLPALEWLLRFSTARRIGEWRRWLAEDLGATELAGTSYASALAASIGAKTAGAWLATPASLEARLDHVRLRDRGLLRLPAAQRLQLIEDFARNFGPGLVLHEAGERGFLLEGGPVASAATVDPARLLDADVGPALPAAAQAGELRRLAAEIEMWLHSAALNSEREQSGQRRITSLWLWGGGADAAAAWRGAGDIHGGDPWLIALAGERGVSAVPARFEQLPADEHAVVELAPMSGTPQESLGALESNWFEPLRAALSAGTLDVLNLVANDKTFVVRARAGWRFWRARRGWLAALAEA